MKKIRITRYVDDINDDIAPGWSSSLEGEPSHRHYIDIPLDSVIDFTSNNTSISAKFTGRRLHIYTDGMMTIAPISVDEILIKAKRT